MSSSSDDSGSNISEATKLYSDLFAGFTTYDTNLTVYDDNGESTVIEDSKMKSRSSDGRAVASFVGVWHPLKREISVFNPTAEVIGLGVAVNGGYGVLYDSYQKNEDGSIYSNYDVVANVSSNDPYDQNTGKIMVAGDFDGDGIDDAVAIYFENDASDATNSIIKWSLYKSTVGNTFSAPEVLVPSEPNGSNLKAYLAMNSQSIASGDIDGDEIVLLLPSSIYVLEVVNGSITIKDSISQPSYEYTAVAVGNLDEDADKLDDVVFSSLAAIDFYEWESETLTQYFTKSSTDVSANALWFSLAIGDFNGDRKREVVAIPTFSVYEETNPVSSDCDKAYIITSRGTKEEISINSPVEQGVNFLDSGELYEWTSRYMSYPAFSVDLDGNGKDELFFGNTVYFDILGAISRKQVCTDNSNSGRFAYSGDINNDGKQDLITTSDNKICGYALLNNAMTLIHDYGAYNYGYYQKIVVGNFDNDSVRVKYAGHELLYTEPVVLAVLASPPYYQSIIDSGEYEDYDPSGWNTCYATATETSSSNTGLVGFSVGLTVDIEQDFSIMGVKLASVKASASQTDSFNWEISSEMAIENEASYECTGRENKVVFSTTPQDTFFYDVYGDDGVLTGKHVTIAVPRKSIIELNTVSFFNAHNGDFADIEMDSELGDPSSYMTYAEAKDLYNANATKKSDDFDFVKVYYNETPGGVSGYDSGTGTSGGVAGTAITVTQTEGYSFTYERESTASAGAGAGGVTISVEAGFSAGYSYASSVSSATSFSGTLGNLPNAWSLQNPDLKYTGGLIAYTDSLYENGPKYWMVTYYIDLQ